MNPPFSALIPAAGNSERMGRDKALLPFAPGVTFARHLTNCYGAYGCNPIVLVVNEQFDTAAYHQDELLIVVNQHVEKGRSWSIHLGLQRVPRGTSCFIQNVDNPFLHPGLLDKLIQSATPDGIAVPVWGDRGGHPVLLGNKVVDLLRGEKELPDFRTIMHRFARVEVPYHDERILLNVNSPCDYRDFIRNNRF
jgi:molybdenum cofactor cytidylyltransferase